MKTEKPPTPTRSLITYETLRQTQKKSVKIPSGSWCTWRKGGNFVYLRVPH